MASQKSMMWDMMDSRKRELAKNALYDPASRDPAKVEVFLRHVSCLAPVNPIIRRRIRSEQTRNMALMMSKGFTTPLIQATTRPK